MNGLIEQLQDCKSIGIDLFNSSLTILDNKTKVYVKWICIKDYDLTIKGTIHLGILLDFTDSSLLITHDGIDRVSLPRDKDKCEFYFKSENSEYKKTI